jgi:hypothetical protein
VTEGLGPVARAETQRLGLRHSHAHLWKRGPRGSCRWSYPDTTIVVSYDLRTGGVEEERVSVWGEDFRDGPGETMLDAESLAEEIWIWLLP